MIGLDDALPRQLAPELAREFALWSLAGGEEHGIARHRRSVGEEQTLHMTADMIDALDARLVQGNPVFVELLAVA